MTPEVLLLAFALGLRHALDPDHLVAVVSLSAGEDRQGPRAAAALGAWWGAGHAIALLAAGVLLIALEASMPAGAEAVLEAAAGALIVGLGLRLVVRTRHRNAVTKPGAAVRGPATAFSVGLVHGLAGSGAVTVLLAASLEGPAAAAALAVFAPATAFSMAAASGCMGLAVARTASASPALAARSAPNLLWALGVAGLLFGLWYFAAAVT